MRAFHQARLPMPLIVAGTALLLVAGCSGRVERGGPLRMGTASSASAPSANANSGNYVWARNDGRRMADNPALFRQGQKDQSECQSEASAGGGLNQSIYFDCMRGRGYSPRTQ